MTFFFYCYYCDTVCNSKSLYFFPFFSKKFFFEKSTKKVQTFRVAKCSTIVTVKEKVINGTFILVVQFYNRLQIRPRPQNDRGQERPKLLQNVTNKCKIIHFMHT